MPITRLIPDPSVFLSLEPEELAGVVLEYLNALPDREKESLSRHNFSLPHTVKEYPQQFQPQAQRALMEAWTWLEREGLLAPQPGSDGWFFISRRGQRMKSRTDLSHYRKAALLPKDFLDVRIASKVSASFMRGDYDTAIFQAFREVEIAAREIGGFSDHDIGVDLMRKAFRPETGPITDKKLPAAEQESMMHLYAGAIGSFKNPHSHRNVSISNPQSAVEMILLANLLLRGLPNSEA